MSMLSLTNAKILTPYETVFPGTVRVAEGCLAEVFEGVDSKGEDLGGLLLAPGFIDIHTHGVCGFDPSEASGVAELTDVLEGMAGALVSHGVTAFLPTLVSLGPGTLEGLMKAFGGAFCDPRKPGAQALGVWLEGPYLSPGFKGAHAEESLRLPDTKELTLLAKLSKGTLRGLTLAPELAGALELVSEAANLGLKVALGHTGASFDEAKKALYRGADRATHLFNAMRPVHHRDPGAALALLESPQAYLELICDLVHVAPEMLRFVRRVASLDRLVAVTDQIAATGLPDGSYRLGGLEVEAKAGRARLSDGTLAGSLLTMDKAFQNLVKVGFSLNEAARMLSLNPARALGLPGMGAILPGCQADFVVLSPVFGVRRVYRAGRLAYQGP